MHITEYDYLRSTIERLDNQRTLLLNALREITKQLPGESGIMRMIAEKAIEAVDDSTATTDPRRNPLSLRTALINLVAAVIDHHEGDFNCPSVGVGTDALEAAQKAIG